jgi:hypothetical protein
MLFGWHRHVDADLGAARVVHAGKAARTGDDLGLAARRLLAVRLQVEDGDNQLIAFDLHCHVVHRFAPLLGFRNVGYSSSGSLPLLFISSTISKAQG